MQSQSPEDLVEAVFDSDPTARSLGITVRAVSSGRVELICTISGDMVNGLGVVHGGVIFMLADTAFAYCCVSSGRLSATRTAEIDYLAPASARGQLHALAVVRRESGRTTICDVTITDDGGTALAEFRGHGSLIRG